MNALIKKGVISIKDAREIVKESLNPNLSEEEKEKILNSIIKKEKNG